MSGGGGSSSRNGGGLKEGARSKCIGRGTRSLFGSWIWAAWGRVKPAVSVRVGGGSCGPVFRLEEESLLPSRR